MITRFSVRVTVAAGIITVSVAVVASIIIVASPAVSSVASPASSVASPTSSSAASPVVVVARDGERINRHFCQPYNRRFADE
ncbi:MAG: hypothetical protein OXU71_12900 [Gammaproteobacteria bacterium]|nr:hypothetical protein [Gammaproteobacteria bacterium]